MIDPVSHRLLQFLPQPEGYFLDNGFVRNYTLVRSVTQNETRYTVRLDHNFSDSFKTNFRYTKPPAIGCPELSRTVPATAARARSYPQQH